MAKPILKNPYSVGFSGEDAVEEIQRKCECCTLPYREIRNRFGPQSHAVCPQCVDHVQREGETADARVARAEDHVEVLRAKVVSVAGKAAGYRTEAANARAQVRAALHSRDRYRGIAEDVAELHHETLAGCSCGIKECRTQKAITGAARSPFR